MSSFKVVSLLNPQVVLTAGPAISAGTQSQNTGTVVFSNSNNVSFGLSNGVVTASVSGAGGGGAAFSAGVSTVGNTAGNTGTVSNQVVFQGGNNVTLSQATGTGGATIIVSGANTVAQSQQPMYYAASGTTSNSNTIPFGNTNGVSFSLSNGSVVATVKTDYLTTQTVQTQASGAIAGTGYTSTTTAGAAITAALGTNGLSMAVPAFITTYVNDLTSGRAGTKTTLALTNLTGTLAVNTDGVALSLNNVDAHFTGWALAGNTAGTSSTDLTTVAPLFLQGGNNITLSGNSNTIVISAGAGGGTTNQTGPNIGVSNLGNTAGTTGTVSTGNVVFAGSNGIVLSQSIGAGSTGATISIAEQPLFAWANNLYQVNTTTIQPRQSTSAVFPAMINNAVTFDHIRFPLTVAMNSTTVGTTANTTFSLGAFYTFNVGFYTTNTANATSVSSALTTSAGLTHQISVQAGTAGSQYTVSNFFTYPANTAGGTATFSTSYNVSTSNLAISTTNLTQFTGMKHFEMAMASSLPANMYWVAIGVSSTTSTQGNAGISAGFLVHSHWAMSQPNNTWGFFGQANNASVQAITGIGSFTTAGGGTVAGFGFSNISSSAAHPVPYIYMEYDG